ncbi:MAG: short-chain dehydrogenase [Chloroflexi bacterium]|nr:short-chain dehydrogenase [Chloroflexota bacterium]
MISSQGQKTDSIIPAPEEFFLNTNLYREFILPDDDSTLEGLKNFRGTVDAFCPGCEDRSVFKRHFPSGVGTPRPPNINARTATREHAPKTDSHFIIELVCTRNENHKMWFCFMVRNSKISKIGQFPSLADLTRHSIEKYRKTLGDEHYTELARAVGLNAHGIGIGSFVYLRRIFERLIEQAHREACQDAKWDELDFAQKPMSEKIKQLSAFLPKTLVENANMYLILSKGIHELSENECGKHFEIIKEGIELILDEMIEKAEREKKTKRITNEVARITGKLRKE